jgi:SET domain-containing protein
MSEDLVEARPSPVHGTGVFARRAIAAGTHVGTYEGHPVDTDGTHVLWIEGTGVLRYLNHSRTPNVAFDGAELYAVRDIAAGEELVFDYGEDWADVP